MRKFVSLKGLSGLKTVAIEVFSVVLAVLLALAANDWRDDRIQQAQTKEALHYIYTELQQNKLRVTKSLEHHESLYSELSGYLDSEAVISEEDAQKVNRSVYQKGLLRPAGLIDGAWETAKISGAVQGLDVETLVKISTAYSFHEHYNQLVGVSLSNFGRAQFQENKQSTYFRGQYEIVNSMMWFDRGLLTRYDAVIQHLESHPLISN